MPAFYEPICRLQRAESHASLLKRVKLCQNYITCSLLNLLSSFFILQVENQKLSLSKSLDRERLEKENKCKLSDDNDALRHQVVLLEKKIGKSNTFFLLFFLQETWGKNWTVRYRLNYIHNILMSYCNRLLDFRIYKFQACNF